MIRKAPFSIHKNRNSAILVLLAALALFVSSCDLFDDCSSSNVYSLRCNGLYIEQCTYTGSSYRWTEYKSCITGCPSGIGNPSCAASTCTCSVQSQYVCERGNTYRCNGNNAEKCTALDNYNGYIWENIKNCESLFSESDVVESGSCSSTSDYYEPKCVPGPCSRWHFCDASSTQISRRRVTFVILPATPCPVPSKNMQRFILTSFC